jgi:predicted Zn-dependent protease
LLAFGLAVVCGLGVCLGAPRLAVWRQLRAAREALARREFGQAQAHLDACLAFRPDDGELHFLAGQTARRRGDYDCAEQHLGACDRLHWSPERVELERALLLAQQGDPKAPEGPLYALVREGHPEGVLILEALAAGSLRSYQLGKAQRYLEEWLGRVPDDFQALLWYGEVQERRNLWPKALDAYRKAVECNPSLDSARLRLARALARTNRLHEAAEQFERLRQRSGDANAVVGLARCRESLGQTDVARRLLDELLAERPEHVEALMDRGRLALAEGQPEEAARLLGKASRLAPFERSVVYQYCRCLERLGRLAETRDMRQRLRQIEQDLRTLEDVHRQVHRDPQDPGPRSRVGLILLRNRQDKEGLRWLDSALRLDPLHRPSHEALAEYYLRQGDDERATYHRRQAATSPPDGRSRQGRDGQDQAPTEPRASPQSRRE